MSLWTIVQFPPNRESADIDGPHLRPWSHDPHWQTAVLALVTLLIFIKIQCMFVIYVNAVKYIQRFWYVYEYVRCLLHMWAVCSASASTTESCTLEDECRTLIIVQAFCEHKNSYQVQIYLTHENTDNSLRPPEESFFFRLLTLFATKVQITSHLKWKTKTIFPTFSTW